MLDRRLIKIAGRKQVVGKPFIYKTTREFLMHFGLAELSDLPPLEEFEESFGALEAELADEFSDTEPSPEEAGPPEESGPDEAASPSEEASSGEEAVPDEEVRPAETRPDEAMRVEEAVSEMPKAGS